MIVIRFYGLGGTANRYSVLVLNTALGWTILGWVIFLAMSVSGAKVRA